jgi:hypothetical protein
LPPSCSSACSPSLEPASPAHRLKRSSPPKWGRAPTDAEITPYWRALVDANREAPLPEVTADTVTGRYVDPRAGGIELGAFADRWLAAQTFDALTRGVSIRAVAEYLGHHDPGFTHCGPTRT